MMDAESQSRMATALLAARDFIQLTLPPSELCNPFDLKDGYAIGQRLHRELAYRGYKPVGRKIGFTNRDTWDTFDLKTSIWAWMYDRTVIFAHENTVRVSLSQMISPRLEPEIVFKFRDGIPDGNCSPAELLSRIEWMALGHLAALLNEQPWAAPIVSGDIITTGTLTALPYIHPGETWRVTPAGIDLSELVVHFK